MALTIAPAGLFAGEGTVTAPSVGLVALGSASGPALCYDVITMSATPDWAGFLTIAFENLTVGATGSAQPFWIVMDDFGLGATPDIQVETTAISTDELTLSEFLLYTAVAVAEEGITVSDGVSGYRNEITVLSELVAFVTQTSNISTIYGTILENLTLGEVASIAYGLTAAETVTLGETLSQAITYEVTNAETVTLTDTLTNSFIFVGTSVENLVLSSTAPWTLTAAFLATEGILFTNRLPIGEEDYQAWVVNTYTTAATKYANFPFNSLVAHDGHYYGVMESGLYELTGEDDDGTDIDAYVQTGLLDFGASTAKNVPRAYAYVKSDGEIYLKTITDSYNERTERWYKLELRDADVLQNELVRLPRGVFATHWAFQLANVDGSSLDLRGFEVVPVILKRPH